MLLALLGGISHSVQHDVASEFAHELTHHSATLADTHERGAHDDKLSHMHSERDCLLGDLSATQASSALALLDYVVLPRPNTPKLTPPVTRMVGATQARAPPISL